MIIRPINYITLAQSVAKLSECRRKQVGAILITRNGTTVIGYNRLPLNTSRSICDNCPREGKEHGKWDAEDICPVIHAESDLIIKAARLGTPLHDGTLYITYMPCNKCAVMLAELGIRKVVYLDDHAGSEDVRRFLVEHRIEVEKYQGIRN